LPPVAAPIELKALQKNERQALRAYSPGVITEGGRIVWLAGQTALEEGRAAISPAISTARPAKCSARST
jgi:hypothetical protein